MLVNIFFLKYPLLAKNALELLEMFVIVFFNLELNDSIIDEVTLPRQLER